MPALTILEALILKIENEQELYISTYKNLIHKAKEIRDKYKIGLKISEFIQKLRKFKTIEEVTAEYEKFKVEKIDEHQFFGDIFELDINSIFSDKVVYSMKVSKDIEYTLPENAYNKKFQISQAICTLGEKIILSSVQYFEEFFSDLLRHLIKLKPEAYFYNKTIEYKELMKTDIETIREKLIDEEVKKLMFGVKETIEKVNETHKLNLNKYQDLWDKYVEIDRHRNVIVHNRGMVNYEYNNSVSNVYKKEENTYIKCDKNLLRLDTECLIKFAYLLCYLIWDKDEELRILEEVAFELLSNGKWGEAAFAYELLCKIPNLNNENKMNFKINYLNAYKHINGIDKARQEIEALDTSGMDNMFFVAKQLLLENNKLVLEKIEKSYPIPFNVYNILKWPIFIEFRKTEEFKEFILRHSHDFEQWELDPKTFDTKIN